ncbi:hypothetical protein HXZ27_08235 [Micromonospora carbonacea subsp. aurantiaca]|uniref:Uncharacterized protein n=1 Tax=Micromonospora carbonacea TaxID=47853 RepID=A0A7H8XHI0_9ACTN|nr:hypothetical protein HXZ27_08235 [Micromonospora carbonacea]
MAVLVPGVAVANEAGRRDGHGAGHVERSLGPLLGEQALGLGASLAFVHQQGGSGPGRE